MNNFARDLQWGQALQLVEERSQNEGTNDQVFIVNVVVGGVGGVVQYSSFSSLSPQPRPFFVEEGEDLMLEVCFSSDSAVLQVFFFFFF